MKKIALTLVCLSFVFSAYSTHPLKIDSKLSEDQRAARAEQETKDSTEKHGARTWGRFAEIEDYDEDTYTVMRRSILGSRDILRDGAERTNPEYQRIVDAYRAAVAPQIVAALTEPTPMKLAQQAAHRVIVATHTPGADRQAMRDSFLAGVTQNFPAAGAIAPNGGHANNDQALRAGQDFGNYLTAARATQGVPVADLLRFLENTLRSIG